MPMHSDEWKLDNPVWYSLEKTQAAFALQEEGAVFYHPDFCPFGAFMSGRDSSAAMERYATLCDSFFMVGEEPRYNPAKFTQRDLICDQMLYSVPVQQEITAGITELRDEHAEDLFKLVTTGLPGYFREKTRLLGHYYGIYENGQLLSVCGERMIMPGFTEVSAVVTHPAHTGKGYSGQLMAHCTQQILRAGQVPYLHVAEVNERAIRVYERAGYRFRRKMNFRHFTART